MQNQQVYIKSNKILKLSVIVLSIVLFSGISLVSTLQNAIQGQVQQRQLLPTPVTIAPPSITPTPPSPLDLGTAGGGAAASETGGGGAASETGGGGAAASETGGGGGAAASETGM